MLGVINMSEPIVVDEYLESVAEFFQQQGSRYENAVTAYVNTLQTISAEGIISGDTAEALKEFIAQAEKLVEGIGNISRRARVEAITFLDDVDEADEYLY